MVEEGEDVAEDEEMVEVAEEEEEEEEVDVDVAEATQMLVGLPVTTANHMKCMHRISFMIMYGNSFHTMNAKRYLKIGSNITRVESETPVRLALTTDQVFLDKYQVTTHNHRLAK